MEKENILTGGRWMLLPDWFTIKGNEIWRRMESGKSFFSTDHHLKRVERHLNSFREERRIFIGAGLTLINETVAIG